MRSAIFLLLFLNAAFFYWARQHDIENQVSEHSIQLDSGAKSIVLLSELDAQDKPVGDNLGHAKNLSANTSNQHPPLTCFSIGPLQGVEESDHIHAILLNLGVQAKQRVVNQRQAQKYWVYLPSYPSEEQAQPTINYLKQNNISEFSLWLASPQQYVISLGLFSSLSNAQNRIKEIERLNLHPQMEVQFEEWKQFWLDFQYDAAAPTLEPLKKQLRNNYSTLILETKCA